jgi:LTXXQ motif family protein
MRSFFPRPLRALFVTAAVAPLFLAGAALAEDAGAPPPHPAAMHAEHHHDPEMMARHISDVLQLRADQQGALHELLESMHPPMPAGPQGDHKWGEHGGMGAEQHLTTPERLDRMAAHLEKMHEHALRAAAAVHKFYDQLTPEQRKAFDAMAPMMLHRHMMMAHHGMGHGGQGWGEHGPKGPGGWNHDGQKGPPPGGPPSGE